MTGTGTQADPYIVDTWPDFVTAVGTSGAYVEIVPGTIWNMNDIAPNGVGNINVSCVDVNGHGAVIQALNVVENDFFIIKQNCSIRRINFKSITSIGHFVSTVSRTVYFKKVSIGGIFNGINGCFAYVNGGGINFTADEPEYEGEDELGCSIAIKMNNGSGFGGSYYNGYAIAVIKTHLDYTGSRFNSPYGRYHGVGVFDSYITGQLGTAEFYYARRSMINAVGTIAMDPNGGSANISQTVVNTDYATISSGPFIGVTDEQMRDAAYLASLGFDIGDQP